MRNLHASTSELFSTFQRKPAPDYRAEMMAKTMPNLADSLAAIDKRHSTFEPKSEQKFMTIEQRKRSRSYVNLVQNGDNVLEVEDLNDEVFDRSHNHSSKLNQVLLVPSELATIRTTPGRKLGVVSSRSIVQKCQLAF